MYLTYGLLSARSLYEKLQRDAEALKEEVNSDRFFNFVVTGYSLIDWVKKDPSVPQTAQNDLTIFTTINGSRRAETLPMQVSISPWTTLILPHHRLRVNKALASVALVEVALDWERRGLR
jgi:hypothetical protein